ncbi:MAG: hypothetical protein KHY83_09095 [Coriobacteriia bacterium]|nr:hypothetical protein [Coriobacteriia bacterium]MBS5478801.1 hypothetical protein [Coriobacteriia bacterium]
MADNPDSRTADGGRPSKADEAVLRAVPEATAIWRAHEAYTDEAVAHDRGGWWIDFLLFVTTNLPLVPAAIAESLRESKELRRNGVPYLVEQNGGMALARVTRQGVSLSELPAPAITGDYIVGDAAFSKGRRLR